MRQIYRVRKTVIWLCKTLRLWFQESNKPQNDTKLAPSQFDALGPTALLTAWETEIGSLHADSVICPYLGSLIWEVFALLLTDSCKQLHKQSRLSRMPKPWKALHTCKDHMIGKVSNSCTACVALPSDIHVIHWSSSVTMCNSISCDSSQAGKNHLHTANMTGRAGPSESFCLELVWNL